MKKVLDTAPGPKPGVSAPALLVSKSLPQASSSKGAPVFPRESIKPTSNPCLFPTEVKLSTAMGLGLPQGLVRLPALCLETRDLHEGEP